MAGNDRSVYRWWFVLVLRAVAVVVVTSFAAAFVVEVSASMAIVIAVLGVVGAVRALSMMVTLDDAHVVVRNFFTTRTFVVDEVRGFGTRTSLLQFPWAKVTVELRGGRVVKATAGSMTSWFEDLAAARLAAMTEDLRRRQRDRVTRPRTRHGRTTNRRR